MDHETVCYTLTYKLRFLHFSRASCLFDLLNHGGEPCRIVTSCASQFGICLTIEKYEYMTPYANMLSPTYAFELLEKKWISQDMLTHDVKVGVATAERGGGGVSITGKAMYLKRVVLPRRRSLLRLRLLHMNHFILAHLVLFQSLFGLVQFASVIK